MWCIIVGNPVDGFYTIGPFETEEAARNYVATEKYPENMWVTQLYEPAEAANRFSSAAVLGLTCTACGSVEGTADWDGEGHSGLCPACADRLDAAAAKED